MCPTWAEQDKSSVRAGPRNVARNQAANPSTLVDSSDTRATHRDQTVVESDLGRMTDKPEIGRITEELQAAQPAAHPKGVLYPRKVMIFTTHKRQVFYISAGREARRLRSACQRTIEMSPCLRH